MNTPITDAAAERVTLDCDDSCLPIYVYVDGKEHVGGVIDVDTARKLELDRAALMEALEAAANFIEPDWRRVSAEMRKVVETARANFPDEN